MSDFPDPQPWWIPVIGGLGLAAKWLVTMGAAGSRRTILSQRSEIDRLSERLDKLEGRLEEKSELIDELREENARLRQRLASAGIVVDP